MAGWCLGERMCRHLFFSAGFVEVAFIFIAIFMSVPTTSYAQEGFLSIDCGYTGANYSDHGLTWTSDYGTYINVGDTFEQPALNSNDVGSQSLQTYRFFPVYRNKYCYELPTINDTYLIRAGFYMNEAVLKANRPFQFIVSLDATNWFTLTSGDDSLSNLYAMEETIFHPPGNVTNFCLRPVIGVPFISSLELRQLDSAMYNYSGGLLQYLPLLFRYTLGPTSSMPPVRFPDDKFDRIWKTATWANTFSAEVNISTSTPPDNTSGSRIDVYYVPPKVMQDGWQMNYSISYLLQDAPVFTLYSQYLPVFMTPSEYVFPVIYSEHLNNADQEVYIMNVTMDLYAFPLNFSNQASMQATPYFLLSSNTIQMGIQSELTLDDGPTINAVEVYGQYDYNLSSTFSADVEAVTALKTSLNLRDWQGDPCTPVPHDWLSCSIFTVTKTLNFRDYQPVEEPCGLNGTSVFNYCAEQPGLHFSALTFSVTSLNISNLSSSDLLYFTNASAHSSAIWLPNLAKLSITHSEVDNITLQLLLDNFLVYLSYVNTDFVTLDLSYNVIDGVPSDWSQIWNLTSLNLSHNQILGEMSSFENAPLKKLDLSYNNLTSLPSMWNNTVSSLLLLDLSHNQLQGSISSLDQLVRMNSGSLQELNISNNNLGGSFSSSLYFSGLPNLTVGNFDQNYIQGTLDLSTWYDALQKAASANSSSNIVTRQTFSFVNNSISGISPSADTINSALELMMGGDPNLPPHGILLGGNPYCNNANSYAQQYLCRYTLDQVIPNQSKKSKSYIIIVSVIGGILALLLSSVTSATLWKLWKQVYSLRAIQKALADRKVQPPFYHYNDLKLATRDFHKDNKLGHGAFGIVYKGVLVDETKLAVKKLFFSRGSQVLDDLDEFLNEVVLITGIKHRNLVQLKGCCIMDKQRMLIYEYAENGNLAEALWGPKAHEGLNWRQRFNICVGVARGLAYLHEELQPSIIHRDIKPENILLDKDFKPKISDFGLARLSYEENQAHYTTKIAGTLGYFSPEYASQGQLSDKADVYSYGIVVLELLSGRRCIDHSLPSQEVYLKDWVRKLHNKGMLFDVLQSELRDSCVVDEVIRAIKISLLCVQNTPGDRPSMSQVVTMLLGNAEINIVLDESDYSRHDLKDLMESINSTDNSSPEGPGLESIGEEGIADFFLLNPNLQPSSSSTNSRSSFAPLIELSSSQGR